MSEEMFKPKHPDWVRRDGFDQTEAVGLGKLAGASPGAVRYYARLHGVSEGLAEEHLVGLLAYAARAGRVYQHRTLPKLRLETGRTPRMYGVLLDLPSVRIVSYETTARSRTWVAARNMRLNARDAEARSPQE